MDDSYSDSSQDYFTPCSPECTVAIDRYLEERASAGELLKYDSPVIRNLYNSLSVKAVKPLSYQGIKNLVRTVVKLSGVRNGFEFEGQVKESRGFRKFYKGEADLSGMVPGIVELTQGHNIGMATRYLTPKESDILKEYEKVLDRITIDEKHRLKKRNEELEKDYLEGLGELRQEFNELKELLGYVGAGEPEPLKKELQRRMLLRAHDMIGYDLSGATSIEAQDKAELLGRQTKREE